MTSDFETTGLLIFAACSLLPLLLPAFFIARTFFAKDPAARRAHLRKFGWSSLVAGCVYAVVVLDSFLLEPNWPSLREELVPQQLRTPLRILHLSDLHVEENLPRREQWLIKTITTTNPDLIVVTGDIHQIGNTNVASLRHVLSALKAPLGVYACIGYDDVRLLREAAPHMEILVNKTVRLDHNGADIAIAGVMPVGNRGPLYRDIAGADLSIVLNHTPDLAEEAAAAGVEMYLCGHTHGGQVRIPFWGAIITNSRTGKKYESGRYQIDGTFANVSRGLGLEPRPAPQVRFFCRPEATLLRIGDD